MQIRTKKTAGHLWPFLLLGVFWATSVQAVNLVQEFYLPMPEAQLILGAEMASPAITDTNYYTITSILTTGNGTVIYYDQWEDGYETNLASPTQPTTLVWGDGNNANGICPGYTNDPVGIPAGTIIALTNTVPSKPRNPAQFFYDGGDRIAANKALVVTRAGWPAPTGPVDGGAAVVVSTLDFGTSFVSPIGQDMPENLFNYVGFFVMVSEDNTVVTIDLDGAGPTPPFNVLLNRGQSYLVNGGVKKGATITTSGPAEANLVCGDTVNSYAYDWFTLYPQSEWSSSYFTPVPSVNGGGTLYTTINYFYNANPNPITILYTNLTGSGSFSVPASGGAEYPMPTNSGASFTSAAGEVFTVLTTVAADTTNNPTAATDTTYNWGYTPLPKGSLTTEADVGWAPGSSDYTINGSPVWVTPIGNTTIYVAYRGTNTPLTDPAGNKYSTNFTLSALQSKAIYVPGTNDQTGMKVYTLDNTLISVAWGEDPATAPTGNPGLDLGTSVLPFPVPLVKKGSAIINDVPPAGLSLGDTIQYSVETDNRGLLPLGNTIIIDVPSATLQYVTNSTTLNGFPIPDTTNGFPLSSPGYTIPIILSQGTSVFQYQAKVIGSGGVSNTVNIGGTSISATNFLPPGYGAPAPAVSVFKTLMAPVGGTAVVGQTVQFNLQIIDSGNTILQNVTLADKYPSNLFSFVSSSIPASTTNAGALTWTNLGSFLPGQATNITVILLATNTSALATNLATATSTGGLGGATNSGSATVTVAGLPTPGITVSKSVLSPVNGLAGMGQTVQYNLQVLNSGTATLTNISLLDNFPATNFNFVSASVPPSTNSAGRLTWTNLGTFVPGQFTNLAVSFTVTNYSPLLTNFMIAASVGGATNTNSVGISMTPGALTITKTVLSPTNTSYLTIGSNVVFRILIQNTGRIPIRTLPLDDTFSGSFFQFVSATIPPSSVGGGDLYWTNLTSGAPLAVNATITNDVTMKITGGPALAYNTAAANFATDTNGNPVAPSSGTVSLNIFAGQITGTVFDDVNQSGVYTNGDTPLDNVTLALFAVSNGVPVALIQSTTTDVNGNYQLMNLSTGAYLVVETLLPGYVGSAPPNNNIFINLTALVTTNVNFFEYQISPTNLASINGTVWKDVTGSGVFQAGDTGIANVEVDLLQDLNTNGVADLADPLVQATFTATNGTYSFGGIVPGNYVIREIVLSNYVATSPSQLGRSVTAAGTTNGNDFFNYFIGLTNGPVAVPDFVTTFVNVPLTIPPLTNDSSPGGLTLTITNVSATNGSASFIGGTNVLFTPTPNFSGTATIGYTVTNLNGKSTSLITIAVLPIADLQIGKSAAALVLAASNLTYTISVTNLGPSSASSVTVTDTVPTGANFSSASGGGVNNSGSVTWNLGNLANGAISNVTLTVTAPASGTLTNVANVSSPTPDPNSTNNVTPPVVTAVTPLADLVIAKTGPTNVLAASNFNYTISVTNLGPSGASSVVVMDTLPAGVTFVSGSGGGATNVGMVIWNLGSLTNGQSSNLTLTVTSPAGGTLTNIASVSSPMGDTNILNNTTPPVLTSVTPVADLAVGKTGAAAGALGVNFNYTIAATNLGPSSAANFSVTDSLPAGIIFVSSLPVTTTNAANQVIWTNLGALASGATTNLTLTVQPATRATFTNVATVGGPTLDNTPTNNTSAPVVTSITNRPPTALNDTASTARNVAVTIPVLTNDSDPDNDSLTIISVNPTNGTASISGANIIYTPTNAVPGTNVLSYTISDGFGGTSTALVTIYVTNRPPVAVNDSVTAQENVAVSVPVLVNDSDPDGDALTIISVSPTNGTAVISGTNVVFTPATNFIGTATCGYGITDNFGGTNFAFITITVTNIPPVANPDVYSMTENTTNSFPVLVNDSVLTPGGSLTIISVSPTNGTASISGTNIVFTPTLNFLGTATIGYTIIDNVGGTNRSLVTITVTNIPPVATPDAYAMAMNATNTFSPLANDSVQTPGGTLSILSLNPTNGTATIAGTNVVFTPTSNFVGTATIGYLITDGIGGTNSSLITISVTNRPPFAANDSASTPKNVAVTIPALVNDSDPDGNTVSLASVSPTNGIASISGTNVVFTPTNNFLGTAVIGYTITDGFGGTNSALIFVTVTNRAPLAINDSASTAENIAVTVPVLVNDSDPDGDALTIISVSPTNGTAVITVTNVVFTPATNFLGTATCGYGITDNFGGTNFALITITVTNVPPAANPDNYAMTENTTNSLAVLLNDVVNTSGGSLTIISITPTNGTASINGTNIVFTPSLNFLGTATVGYTIIDNVGGTNSCVVTITVTNIPPLANPDGNTVFQNSTNTFAPLTNDVVRTPGGTLGIVSVSATNGTASISGTNVIFTPAPGFTGTATIGYTVTDGIGGTNSSIITVNVLALADIAASKSGPASVYAATNFDYTITVTNFGPGAAASLSVTDDLPVAVAFVSASAGAILNGSQVVWTNLGSLAANAATNLTVTVTAPATGVTLTNVASAGSPTSDPKPTNNITPPVITTVTPQADVQIFKTGPASVLAAGSVTYTIFVTNAGPSSASNVVVTDTLPVGVTFVAASGNGANNSGIVNWSLGALAAGQSSNLTVAVTAPVSGTLTNVANVSSPTSDPNQTNNVTPPVITSVGAVADLQIGKSAPASVLAAGNVVYTISVTNFGPSIASSVTVTDAVPAGASFVSASGGGVNNSGEVIWSLGDLTSGAVSNVTLTVTAPASGSLTNTASVGSPTGDPNPTNNMTPPVFTSITPVADVSIVKSGPAGILFGTNFNYTLTVSNAGPSTATSLSVTDSLPTGLILVSAVPAATTNANQVIWTLGDFAAGTGSNLTLTVISTQRGSLTNLASAGSPTFDPVPTNNPAPPVVTAVTNIPPIAIADSYAIAENSTNTFSPLDNDVLRTPGGSLTLIAVNPANGTATIVGNNVVFTPTNNFLGVTIIGYTITDNVGGTNSSFITVLVTNIPPVANPDPYSMAMNTTNTFSPLVNDSVQTPGGSLSLLSVSPTNGTATIAGTNVVFTPTPDFVGTATIGYVITDGIGGTNSSLITISVTNRPPVAANDFTSTPKNVAVTIPALVNDSDPDGNTVLLASVSPTNGIASISGTNVIFTPTNNFLGTAIIGYSITDGFGGTNSALIFVTVTNRAPLAVNDSGSTPKNVAVTVPVLANDSDLDGDALTIVSVSATNGIASISGTNVIFTPTNNFLGTAIIGYTITDGFGGTNSALIFVTVTNRAPIAANDSSSTPENVAVTIPVLVNDSDPDGDALTIVSVSPTNGSAVVSGTNVVFTPATNFVGTATCGYGITDNFGGTNFAVITITVTNVPPVANPDTYAMTENTTNSFPVLVNDLVLTPGGSLTIISVSPTNGTASISGTNIVFTPTLNFLGTATIGYTIIDNVGGTNHSLVTITVTNIPPVANPDNYSMAENTTNTFAPLVNDAVQTPGGVLSILGLSPTNGTGTILNLTNVVFTPSANFVGIATIGYTITDGIGGTNSSVITVNVTNIPPTAFSQSLTTPQNTALPITLTGSDPAGHSLTFVIVGAPSGGTLTGLNTNTGAVTYTPTNSFSGTDSFTFRVNNGYNSSATATVIIAVTPVADLLVAQSGPTAGVAGANLIFTVAVTNLGPAGATNVIVTNQIDSGFTFVSASANGALNGNLVTWTISVLPANDATNFTVTLAAIEGGTFTNIASGISITPDLNAANNNGSLTNAQVVTVVSASADVAVFKTGTSSVLAGGSVNYAIVATNFGPSTASNVVVRDNLPAGATLQTASGNYSVSNNVITWASTTLPGGAATNFTVTLTAPFGGALTNMASSTSDTADPNPGNNDGSSSNSVVITPVTPVANLAIGKSAAASVLATSNLIYTISVTNFGPSTASSVTVTDAVPIGASFVSASGGGANNSGVVTWNLGNLSSGAVSNVTLTVLAPASGSLTNVATVGSPTGDPNPTNNITPPVLTAVTPVADVAIGKSGPAGVTFNTNFSYTISVTNFGPSTASGIWVTDTLPTGIAFVSAVPATTTNAASQVIWNLGDLASGATSNLALTVVSTMRSTVTNFASAGAPTLDPSPTNNLSQPVVTLITNIPPVANPDSYAIAENTTNAFAVLVNDQVRNPGGFLTLVSVSPTNGVATISGANVVLTPALNFLGTLTLSYTIIDNVGGTNSSFVTVLVTNVPPVANPDSYSMAQNSTNTFLPLVNDLVQTPGGVLSIIGLSPTNGTATFTGSNVVFTPTLNFIGTATIGYIITDGIGGASSSLITISVTNRPPVAVNDFASTPKNFAVTVPALANDSDPDGNSLSLASVSPTNGIASISGTNVIFTPTNNFLGTAIIGYTIADGLGGSNSALIFVTVTNRAPVALNDSASAPENVTVTIPVLVNDSDPDGDALTIISVSPTNGTAVISGTNVVFTPATNFVGTATVGYFITDNFGGTNSALITISVTNRPPLANPDNYALTENTTGTFAILVNDVVQTPGGSLGIIAIAPTNGAASISGTNLIFTPALNFLGTATIGYTIIDNVGGTNSSIVTVLVTNVPPVANPDNYSVAENSTNSLSPLINDVLLTPSGTLSITAVNPTNGTASISGTNVVFTPSPNFLGTAYIGYTITDGIGGSSTSLITIAVTNIPPIANPDNYSVTENSTNTFSPLINDLLRTPGGTLSLVSVSPTNGTATISGTNVLFVPATNFLGVATIGYTITDSIGGTNTSLITVLVTNIPPLANPDSYSMAENTTNTFAPSLNDVVRTTGGVLQIIGISPTNGIASINGTNVIFTPTLNFLGTATIGYTIIDNVGGTNSSIITVLVTNVPPIANPDSYTVGENSGTSTFSPLVNDLARTPGGVLSLINVSPTNGTATISGTNVLFAPALNFFGIATIGYTISDGVGGTSTSLITVNVTNVPPVANGQSVSTPENVALPITLTGSDPNSLPLTFVIMANPTNGTLSGLNPNTGAVSYTPNTNYAGADSFTFRVNNGQTNSATATVNISVIPVADLIVVESGPATGFAGSNLVFIVSVTNRGPANATSLVISNRLAPGFTFVNASGGGVNNAGLVTWNFASLPANGATNFTVTAFATEGGAFTNIASGASAVLDLNPTNNDGLLANAQTLTVLTPVADIVVFKDGGTNVYAGATVSYTITASNAGPSTATSTVVQDTLPAGATFQSASGSYSFSNGVVTWSGITLAPGAMTTFNITLLASPSVTSFVNIASGASPAFDPNPTNNNGSFAKSRVTTKVTPSADVIAALVGPTSAILGSNMIFTVFITNAGPSTASNIVVSDTLPANLIFVSASNGGATNASRMIVWPAIASLAAGGSTNFTFTAKSLVAGLFTNIVSSTSTTFDPNPTNNTGVLPTAQAQTQVVLPQFTLLQGVPVFNPQTGLYEEQVTVTNSGATTVAGSQLYVGGLRSGVSLYNANGTNGGTPYVQYNFPINPSNTVHFVLEFYDPSRLAFTNTLWVVAITNVVISTTGISNSVPINTFFSDTRTSPTRFVIEWATVIGKTYTVIYADSVNATNWYVGTPSITATANITQWYDDGPPKTMSPPASAPARFYRVIQSN